MQDLSFAIPQRKKLRLELTRLLAPSAGVKEEYLRARNQASHEVEFGVPMSKIREFYFDFFQVVYDMIYTLFFPPSFPFLGCGPAWSFCCVQDFSLN